MRVILKIAAAAAVAAAVPAGAAPVITSAAVTGPSGTVWNTKVDSYYTLFLQNPYGNNLNPNDNFTSAALDPNRTDVTMAGDGWPQHSVSGNSDPYYTLTLILTENNISKTLSGIFTEPTMFGSNGSFAAVNGIVNFSGVNYSLTDFNWFRGMSNIVGSYSVASKNDPNRPIGANYDYQGAFTIKAAGVPEPATWGLMILGFGAVAGMMRRRREDAVEATA